MDVKEAVRTAKDYLTDLFVDEEVVNIGLEEVVFDDATNRWSITIGFSRPWDQGRSEKAQHALRSSHGTELRRRLQERGPTRSFASTARPVKSNPSGIAF